MNVGLYLRGKSAFTTRQNSSISYGKLYGKVCGNPKAHQYQMSKTKRNSLYHKRIALIQKKLKKIFRFPYGIHKTY